MKDLARQRNHTMLTFNTRYANNTGVAAGLWDERIRGGRIASQLWCSFWNVDEIAARYSHDRGIGKGPSLGADLRAVRYQPVIRFTTPALLRHAKQLFAKPDFTWRSAEQRLVLDHICSGLPEIVAVLPTGAGKSLLFILPASMPNAGVTIVVLPLVSLQLNMLQRLKAAGITASVWSPGANPVDPIVIVSLEAVGTSDF